MASTTDGSLRAIILLDARPGLSEGDILRTESKLGFRIPRELREMYRRNNGGRPALSLLRNESVDTLVTEFLPLAGAPEVTNATDAYELLAITHKEIPTHLFPFAADMGGDYFLIDTSTQDGEVYLYRHDTAFEHVRRLELRFAQFWSDLQPEDV